MENLIVLDCSLRDGGYVNNWKFGKNNIRNIISGLVDSNIEIIECGFISKNAKDDLDVSVFSSFESLSRIIPAKKKGTVFVCMINYGEFDIDNIPDRAATSLDGIRVAFHKKSLDGAIEYCKKIKEKGYMVFVQPMVTLTYTDNEFIDLIKKVNDFNPYAFYIVDSFGVMNRNQLKKFYALTQRKLKRGIAIGYHSHNNMQLAFSNAQTLIDIMTDRPLILDASIFGMGRGAGNLNTELLIQHLNETKNTSYELKPILQLIDSVINPIYQKTKWGYSLSNYLSARHNCHPNYARYLDEKMTLSVDDINEIFCLMDEEKKNNFDKNYIESLFLEYMDRNKINQLRLDDWKKEMSGKSVLIIAPGYSVTQEQEKLTAFIKENPDIVKISVNHKSNVIDCQYAFFSNIRRFRKFSDEVNIPIICTSNIPFSNSFLQLKFSDFIVANETVKSNSTLMLINILISLGIKKVFIAGLDGYNLSDDRNYQIEDMELNLSKKVIENFNENLSNELTKLTRKISIDFVTSQKNIKLKK